MLSSGAAARGASAALPSLDAEFRPPSPLRLPTGSGGDGVLRIGARGWWASPPRRPLPGGRAGVVDR